MLLSAPAFAAQALPPGTNIVALRAVEALSLLPAGSSPLVAVLDTPFELDHPALEPRLLEGYNAFTGGKDTGIAADDLFLYTHGTAVASIISSDTLHGLWPRAVFPDARILPVKVCCTAESGGRMTNSQLLHDGILYAAGIPNGSGQAAAEPAGVINVSFVLSEAFDAPMLEAVTAATEAGSVVVVALGEGEPKIWSNLAQVPGLIGVRTASVTLKTPTVYERMPFVPAPGSDILALLPGGSQLLPFPSLGTVAGSSFATAVTSAVVAMMRAANPDLTPADVAQILSTEAVYDEQGLDALLAVQTAKNYQATGTPGQPGTGQGGSAGGGAMDATSILVLMLLVMFRVKSDE